MNYGEIVGDALRVVWRNKFLWFFGFFAGGTGSNFANISSNAGNFDGNGFQQSGVSSSAFGAQVGPGVFDSAAFVAGLVVVAALLVVLFLAMNVISQGALAESVAALDRGEGRRFSSGWRAGLGNFWRVLLYYVVFFLVALGLLVVIGVPIALLVGLTFAATESVGARVAAGVVAALLGLLALIVVFVPLSIIGRYALRETVVRRERVLRSVAGGYGIFRRNIGRSLLLWLINLGLGIGITIAFFVAALIVGLILFAPAIALGFADLRTAAVIAGVIGGLILVPLLLVASGASGAFFHSYWTLAYLRLTEPPPVPAAAPTPPEPGTGPSYG